MLAIAASETKSQWHCYLTKVAARLPTPEVSTPVGDGQPLLLQEAVGGVIRVLSPAKQHKHKIRSHAQGIIAAYCSLYLPYLPAAKQTFNSANDVQMPSHLSTASFLIGALSTRPSIEGDGSRSKTTNRNGLNLGSKLSITCRPRAS